MSSQGAGWLVGCQWGRQRTGWEARCLCSKAAMVQPARVTCEGACGCRRTPRRGAGRAGREGPLLDKRNTPCLSAAASRLLESCRVCPRLWRALSQLGPRGLPPPDSAAGDLRSPNQGSSWAGPPSLRRKRPLRLAGPERKPSSFVSQLCGLGRPLWEAGVRTVPASIQAGSWEDMFKAPSSAWHLTGMLRELAVAVLTQEVALGTSFEDPGV